MYSVLIFMFFFSLTPPPSGFPCGNHGHLRSSFAPAPLRLFRTSHAAASRPDPGGEVTNFKHICIMFSSTAQGGGGSFKDRTLQEKCVVVMHGWQSESTDGPKGGWSCVFWSGCNGCGHNCWMQCGGVQLQLQLQCSEVVVVCSVTSVVQLQLQLWCGVMNVVQCAVVQCAVVQSSVVQCAVVLCAVAQSSVVLSGVVQCKVVQLQLQLQLQLVQFSVVQRSVGLCSVVQCSVV